MSSAILAKGYTTHPNYGFPGAGVKVYIHDCKEPALIQNFGVSIPSGHTGHIVMRKNKVLDVFFVPYCSIRLD
ncbi:unnamed protein product [Clavelina lepadiformis]|uniref:Uncharacterized protein n=1 Tax=Clavelina lepadiformis TaxID=159417 RepID=A0ABP0H206_CLALP